MILESKQQIPGQLQLVTVEQYVVADAYESGRVPRYQDVELTPEQVEEAVATWPDATHPQAMHYMRSRIFAKLRHNTILDPVTGRRAFGGPQEGTGNRKKRLDESILAASEERIGEIKDAIFSALHKDNDPMVRHKAGMNLIKEARDIRALELQEDTLEKASDDELRLELAKLLADSIRSGDIDVADLLGAGTVVDAEAEVVD